MNHQSVRQGQTTTPRNMFTSLFEKLPNYVTLKIQEMGPRSPIRSVIIQVIKKSDNRAAGVRFVYHKYDYRPNWTTQSLITN